MKESLVITPGTVKKPVMDADGRDVVISGNGCEVELSGTCRELKVIGNEHRVRAEAAETVSLTGRHNRLLIGTLGAAKFFGSENELRWQRAMGEKKAPNFNLSGEGNSVSMEPETPPAESV